MSPVNVTSKFVMGRLVWVKEYDHPWCSNVPKASWLISSGSLNRICLRHLASFGWMFPPEIKHQLLWTCR